jgi:N-acyl-phosphatidylethanolamine-hydrolysing phospholipase D
MIGRRDLLEAGTDATAAARRRIVLPLVALAFLAGCIAMEIKSDVPAHHDDNGYHNSNPNLEPRKLGDFLRWRWQRAWSSQRPSLAPTPVVAPDLAFLQANAAAGKDMVPSATWIGHSSMLVQAGGLNVLTDPVFSDRASPVQWLGPQRAQAPGLTLAQLPHIDVVVISHSHYDHLDLASIRALAAQAGGAPLFLVPMGLKSWMADIGVRSAEELDWWQSRTIGGNEFFLTPVQHWSARGLLDRNETLWGGWAVFGPDFQWYFAGDTGYSDDFRETHRHFASRQPLGGFDLAIIPIGAYEPRWFMQIQHVNPDEAVRIHQEVGARHSIGVHWGTFALTDEALDQPPRDLAQARKQHGLAEDDFTVLAIGETRRYAPR